MTQEEIFQNDLENKGVDSLVIRFSEDYLKEKSKILDLGCGSGRHSVFLAKKGHEVYALDKSKIALQKLKKHNLHNIRAYHKNILKLNFPENYFDTVMSIMVLHHNRIINIRRYLERVKTVLKRGGYFCFSVLSSEDSRANSGKEIEGGTRINIKDTFDSEVPHHFFEEGELKKFLQNFKILEMKQTLRFSAKGFGNFLHWDVIAQKK